MIRSKVCVGVTAMGLLALAAPAQAAPANVNYKATTDTAVVQVVLNLPTALPNVPNPAVLTLIGTDGQGFHSQSGGSDVSTAHSYLAGGSLVTNSPLSPVFAPLSRTVTSTLGSPSPASPPAISVPSNPLGLTLNVGSQKAKTTTSSLANDSSGSVADGSLGSLKALGVADALNPVLTPLNGALQQVVTQAAPLTTAVKQVPTLPVINIPNPLSGVLGGPSTIPTPAISGPVLSSTINDIPAQVKAIEDKLLNGAVLDLTGVATSQAVTPFSTGVTGTGATNALDLSLFGGLVTVTAAKSSATATASTVPGSGVATADATLVKVHVSDALGTLLNLVVSEQGVTAGLLNGALGQTLDATTRPAVQAVDAALNTVLAQLVSLLQQLNGGVKIIKQGTATHTVSADGTKAESHATPAEVSLGLATLAPHLVTVTVGKADAAAEVSPAIIVCAVPSSCSPPVPVPPHDKHLPFTGGNTDAALAGLALLSVAGILARRRRLG